MPQIHGLGHQRDALRAKQGSRGEEEISGHQGGIEGQVQLLQPLAAVQAAVSRSLGKECGALRDRRSTPGQMGPFLHTLTLPRPLLDQFGDAGTEICTVPLGREKQILGCMNLEFVIAVAEQHPSATSLD